MRAPPTSRDTKASLQIWLPTETRQRLKILAAQRAQTITDLLRALIDAELAKA